MNSNKIWVAGATMLAVVILAGGWFLGAAPQLSAAATAASEREGVEAQNQLQEANLASLRERFASLNELNTELTSVRESLPTGADMPTFLRDINAAAETSGVTLNSFGTSDDQPFAPAALDAPAEPTTGSSGGESTTATDEAAPTADAAVSAEAPVATDLVPATASIPGGELVSGSNFVTIPISLSLSGSYESVMAFINAMQKGDRLFLITGLNLTSGGEADGFNVEIEGLTYSLLDTAAAPVEPVVPGDATTATVN